MSRARDRAKRKSRIAWAESMCEAAELIAAHKDDRAWEAERIREWEKSEAMATLNVATHNADGTIGWICCGIERSRDR